MSHHDDSIALRQMLDHAREAVSLSMGFSQHDLERDRIRSLALIRLLEVIGEAAMRVSSDTQQRLNAIPWRDIVSLRNRLIHGYDSVDLAIVSRVLSDDLPALIEHLERALEE